MKNNKLGSSGIGGQAVLEGIMMRNKNKYAIALRQPDGTISVRVKKHKNPTSRGFRSLPFIRGIFALIDSLTVGIRTLTYSANFIDEDEVDENDKFEMWLIDKFGERAEKVIVGFTLFISIVVAVALFFILPLFVADMMARFVPGVTDAHVPLIEGVLKVLIFIIYLVLTGFIKDIKRTYMYHGSEHKCINCIESGKPLNIDNVQKSSRFHKRCGTSFLFVLIILSIIILMCVQTDITWLRYTIRILLIPVIAGIGYEFIRLAGCSNNIILRILSAPGMWMQRITTKEPTRDMIEVAIVAVESVFEWREWQEERGIDIGQAPLDIHSDVIEDTEEDERAREQRRRSKHLQHTVEDEQVTEPETYEPQPFHVKPEEPERKMFDETVTAPTEKKDEPEIQQPINGSGFNWKF